MGEEPNIRPKRVSFLATSYGGGIRSNMNYVKPPAIEPGDTIAIVSPSSGISHVVPRRFERGVQYLEGLGFGVKVMAHGRTRYGHRAATYEAQAGDINQAFADPEVRLILSSIGGFTCNGVLRFLDWNLIRRNPKILIGYSDTTALLAGIHARTGLITFHGPALLPTVAEFPEMLAYTRNCFLDVITGKTPAWGPSREWTIERLWWDKEDNRPRELKPNPGWRVFRKGRMNGRLVGGNLTILLALAGTDYFPDTVGKVLFLEDDSAASLPYWDLHFNQLREMGVFDQIEGLLIGRMEGIEPAGPNYDFETLLREQLGGYDFPVAWEVDFGHTDPMMTLPLGIKAAVDTDSQTVSLCEAAVVGKGS